MEEHSREEILPFVLGDGLWANSEADRLKRKQQAHVYRPFTVADLDELVAAARVPRPREDTPGYLEYYRKWHPNTARRMEEIIERDYGHVLEIRARRAGGAQRWRQRLEAAHDEAQAGFSEASRPAATVFPTAPGILAAARKFLLSGPASQRDLQELRRKLFGDSPYARERDLLPRHHHLGDAVPLLSRLSRITPRTVEESWFHQKPTNHPHYVCGIDPASPGGDSLAAQITLDEPDSPLRRADGLSVHNFYPLMVRNPYRDLPRLQPTTR